MRVTWEKKQKSTVGLSSLAFAFVSLAPPFNKSFNIVNALVPRVENPCEPLISGTDDHAIVGEVCSNVVADHLEVDLKVTAANCYLAETHICNLPTEPYAPESLTTNHIYMIDIEEVYDFVCSFAEDLYVVAGHATVSCDAPIVGDGRMLQAGAIAYTAYYEIKLVCENWSDSTTAAPAGGGGGAGGTIVIDPRTLDEMVRFSKVYFKNESLSELYGDRIPLLSGSYPIAGETKEILSRYTQCISVRNEADDLVPRYDTSPQSLEEVLGDLDLYDGPSHPEHSDYWVELDFVVRSQLQRRQCGSTKKAADVWNVPQVWADATLDEAAEAVHDEYPGLWPTEHIKTLFGSQFPAFKPEYIVDETIINPKSRAGFLKGVILLAEINTWAVSMVGQYNFATKWRYGRARPEEVAWKVKQGELGLQDGVPQRVIDNVNALSNYTTFFDFSAYPEGSPTHPSWPAMHSAASACSLWLPVVMNMTDDQREEVRRLDYAISFARTIAGVHYVRDNLDGLRIGQEIVARELPAYLHHMYGSDPEIVREKVRKERFDWEQYDHSLNSTLSLSCA